MEDKLFLDTNIVLRAFNKADALYPLASKSLTEWVQSGIELWVSRQVLREYLFVVTRPQVFLEKPKTPAEAVYDIQQMQTLFLVADETAQVTEKLLELVVQQPTGGRQIFDANIVATMLHYQIPKLVTLNVSDFLRFQNVITIETLAD